MCTGEIVKVSEPETDVTKGYLGRFLKVMVGDKSVSRLLQLWSVQGLDWDNWKWKTGWILEALLLK